VNGLPRGSYQTSIGKIIDALRYGPKSYSQLAEATKIPQSSLTKHLDTLSIWGLATKDENELWVWKEYYRTYKSEAEFNSAISHSKIILPGLEGILARLGVASFRKQFIDWRCALMRNEIVLAMEHLRTGYPHLHQMVNELWAMYIELADNVPSSITRFNYPLRIDESTSGFDEFWDFLIKHDVWYHLYKLVDKDMISNMDEYHRRRDAYIRDIVADVALIIEHVDKESEPLKGVCDFCPNIRINEP